MAHQPVLQLAEPLVTPDLARGSIFFVGTATVIIHFAEFVILTDPNFIHRHEKVDLDYGLKATRLTDPALDIADLPPLDLILLSHFHGDHFDQVAVRELDKALPICTTPHAAKELRQRGFTNTQPLETWETLTARKGEVQLQITSCPGRHGPPLIGRVLPPVMGSILEFSRDGQRLLRMYITGDTLVYDQIAEIPRRYPDIDLALLHLGGTRVLGIMVTMDGKQGVRMLKLINPKTAIPIHYNDYDVFKSPLDDFRNEVRAAGLESRVHYLKHGEMYDFELG